MCFHGDEIRFQLLKSEGDGEALAGQGKVSRLKNNACLRTPWVRLEQCIAALFRPSVCSCCYSSALAHSVLLLSFSSERALCILPTKAAKPNHIHLSCHRTAAGKIRHKNVGRPLSRARGVGEGGVRDVKSLAEACASNRWKRWRSGW